MGRGMGREWMRVRQLRNEMGRKEREREREGEEGEAQHEMVQGRTASREKGGREGREKRRKGGPITSASPALISFSTSLSDSFIASEKVAACRARGSRGERHTIYPDSRCNCDEVCAGVSGVD
eukprot:2329519-Rhodomonas_salina.1